ncbi:MAG: protein translocase subunit SecF, partial [Patescibacteria group bacterium]
SNFVVAMLVVMGFSVHDTIVVFDRVRENLKRITGKVSFEELVNKSMLETFARSVNTSLTVVLVLVAMLFFGEPNLGYFIMTLLVGILTGTYSSIFIASPVLVDIALLKAKRG